MLRPFNKHALIDSFTEFYQTLITAMVQLPPFIQVFILLRGTLSRYCQTLFSVENISPKSLGPAIAAATTAS